MTKHAGGTLDSGKPNWRTVRGQSWHFLWRCACTMCEALSKEAGKYGDIYQGNTEISTKEIRRYQPRKYRDINQEKTGFDCHI